MKTNKNHLVIIVGLGKSIGMELSKKFGDAGFQILLIGQNRERLSKAVNELTQCGIIAYSMDVNISSEDDIRNVFLRIKKLNIPINLLIYNAVSRRIKTPSNLTTEDVIADFKINVGGAINCISQLLPIYREQNYGSIIFTGGGVAITPSLQSASMSISKAGLRNYALNLSNELLIDKIFVGIITITHFIDPSNVCDIVNAYFNMYENKTINEIEV